MEHPSHIRHALDPIQLLQGGGRFPGGHEMLRLIEDDGADVLRAQRVLQRVAEFGIIVIARGGAPRALFLPGGFRADIDHHAPLKRGLPQVSESRAVVVRAVKQLAIGRPDLEEQHGVASRFSCGRVEPRRVQPSHDVVHHGRFSHATGPIDQQIGKTGGFPDRVQHVLLHLVEEGMPGRKGFELVEAGLGVWGDGAIGL